MSGYTDPQEVAVNSIEFFNYYSDVFGASGDLLSIEIFNVLAVADRVSDIAYSTDAFHQWYVLNVVFYLSKFLDPFICISDANLSFYI